MWTVADRCELDASCAFGELELLVPSRYRVEPDSSTSFGSFEVVGHCEPLPVGTIYLDASVSFGQITVKYI